VPKFPGCLYNGAERRLVCGEWLDSSKKSSIRASHPLSRQPWIEIPAAGARTYQNESGKGASLPL
jgi:hypothetical protein